MNILTDVREFKKKSWLIPEFINTLNVKDTCGRSITQLLFLSEDRATHLFGYISQVVYAGFPYQVCYVPANKVYMSFTAHQLVYVTVIHKHGSFGF